MPRFVLSLVAVALTATLVRAEAEGPFKVTLHPAPLPSPALKYRLLPDLRSQTAGNAVPLYEDAIGKLKPLQRDPDEQPKWQEHFPKWLEMPLKDLPRDEVRKALEPYKEILELAEKAARREYCDWELAKRISKGGLARMRDLGTLLPEVQFIREMGTLLAVRARLEIADGDLTRAVRTLQTGLAMAKQIGEQPTLINYLVGAAIAQIMLRQVDDFVQQPKAPNLYWALADLPQPTIDPRKAFEGERLCVFANFPGIGEAMADLNAGAITMEQVQGCVKVLVGGSDALDVKTVQRKLRLTQFVTAHYEDNKKVLLAQGRPKDKVAAMPHIQVGLMAELSDYEQMWDDQMKWCNEPYYQVAERLDAAYKAAKAQPPKPSILPDDGFALLVPAVSKVVRARPRLQRKIDILRCVEAIRAYAAGHEGKLPASLDDIKDVPIPLDPATGRAFAYKVVGDKALLTAPAVIKEMTPAFTEVAYEIRVER